MGRTAHSCRHAASSCPTQRNQRGRRDGRGVCRSGGQRECDVRRYGFRGPIRAASLDLGAALLLLSVVVTAPASDAADLRVLTFLKGCESPTFVGQESRCNFTLLNTADPDTLTITSL